MEIINHPKSCDTPKRGGKAIQSNQHHRPRFLHLMENNRKGKKGERGISRTGLPEFKALGWERGVYFLHVLFLILKNEQAYGGTCEKRLNYLAFISPAM